MIYGANIKNVGYREEAKQIHFIIKDATYMGIKKQSMPFKPEMFFSFRE